MRARDFLLVLGDRTVSPDLLAWHERLGGRPDCWSSALLGCTLWGGPPSATVIGREGETTLRAACLLTGAPLGFASVDADTVQQQLLEVYRAEGIDALRRVDGSFCGVLLDELRRVAYVFTDRFGFRKAFIARAGAAACASSRAIVLGRGLALQSDPAGAVCSTLIGHTIGTRTLFSGCDAILPATAVDLSTGQHRLYWDIRPFLAERTRSDRDTAELCDRFNVACRSIVNAQQVPALNLTGGFDTRAVLSGALTARRPLVGITAGAIEKAEVNALATAAGIDHHLLHFDEFSACDDDEWFAMLTDGECDATGGGAALKHWRRLSSLAPSGCLHGGVGEVWRAYYYQLYWPSVRRIRRDPVAYLAKRLVSERQRLLPTLAEPLRRSAADIVRAEVEALWATLRGADLMATVDAFYLLERQRGLTRISAAADLWNPAYSPFAHSIFIEKGLGFLGAQNRGDPLHRDLIARNARQLAALPRYPAGDCLPRSRWRARAGLIAATARYAVGRGLGAGLRQRLQGRSRREYPYRMLTETFDASAVYDVGRVRRGGHHASLGLGSVAAVTAALGGTRCRPLLIGSY